MTDKKLTPEQEYIANSCGTERPFTGPWLDEKRAGTYVCVKCGEPLFLSQTKYDSGSGWPSFYAPASKDALGMSRDTKLGMERVEVHCSKCGAHMGHLFPDGPQPTGMRYCINGTVLDFKPDGE